MDEGDGEEKAPKVTKKRTAKQRGSQWLGLQSEVKAPSSPERIWSDRRGYFTNRSRKISAQYAGSGSLAPPSPNSVSLGGGGTHVSTLEAHSLVFRGVTAFISSGVYLSLPAPISLTDGSVVDRLDHKEVGRLILQNGGRMTHSAKASVITHFITNDIPIWLLRRDQVPNVTTIQYRLTHPQWAIDCVEQGTLLPATDYSLPGDVARPASIFTSFSEASPLEPGAPPVPPAPSTTRSPASVSARSTTAPTRSLDQASLLPPPAPMAPPPALGKKGSNERVRAGDIGVLGRGRGRGGSRGGGIGRGDSRGGRMLTSSENPNFVRDYFKHSRLHHLSAWKLQFQDQIRTYLKDKGVVQPKQVAAQQDRIIVHVDMDAFFVTASLLSYPHLKDKPVGVAYGGDSSDVSSCNYIARKEGVHNGMSISNAMKSCPGLQIIPYDFPAYERISTKVFEILVQYSSIIQANSCDEALLDMSHVSTTKEVEESMEKVRSAVFKDTQCTCSVGIGNSILLARLALKKAKPNGIHVAPFVHRNSDDEEHLHYWLRQFEVSDFPLVGWRTSRLLREKGLADVALLHQQPLPSFIELLGDVKGKQLYDFLRGIDNRTLVPFRTRATIGVDLTYAIRFSKNSEIARFFLEVCEEVSRRMKKGRYKGKKLSIMIMKRKANAKASWKHLGHGSVDTMTRTGHLPSPTDEATMMHEKAWELYKTLDIPPKELRGVGVHMAIVGAEPTKKRGRVNVTASQPSIMSAFKRPRLDQTLTTAPEVPSPAPASQNIVPLQLAPPQAPPLSPKYFEVSSGIIHIPSPSPSPRISSPLSSSSLPLFERESFSVLSPLLKEWIQIAQLPSRIHLEILYQFLRALIIDKNLELLSQLLRRLRYLSASSSSVHPPKPAASSSAAPPLTAASAYSPRTAPLKWGEAIEMMVEQLQLHVLQLYGSRLRV